MRACTHSHTGILTLLSCQAHDWEAYQELLAKQKGPEGASERYEVINRFLDDTEDYLHKLAGKVASVKLSQEASEAAAQAMAEARAQVGPTGNPDASAHCNPSISILRLGISTLQPSISTPQLAPCN